MLTFLLVLFFIGIIAIIVAIGIFIYDLIKSKPFKVPIIVAIVGLLLAIGGYQFGEKLNANQQVALAKKYSESSSKAASESEAEEPVIKLDGKAKNYTDYYFTANSNRQAIVSGTATHTKTIKLQENFGDLNETKIKVNSDGTFSKTITLPKDKAKASYYLTAGNDEIVTAHIKSVNYEAEQTSIDQAKASSRAESSSNKSATNATKYQAKLNSLNKGTAESASYDASTNTVTWIGFDDWKTWSDSELQKSMDLLQTMTLRQESNYDISSVHIVVQLPNGTVIAKNSDTDMDLQFIK